LLALTAADADPQRHLAQLLLGNADESPLEPRDRSALQIQQAGADLSDHAALLEGTSLPVLLEDEREERGVGPAADGQERLVRAAEAVESLLDHGMAQYGAGLGVDEDRHVQRIRRSAGGATGVGDHLDTVFEP